MKNIDVLVIGAGPSGTVAASHLANQGYKVMIVEKQEFPRYVIGAGPSGNRRFCSGTRQKHSINFKTSECNVQNSHFACCNKSVFHVG